MIEGLYLPPKPAILRPKSPTIVRPEAPRFKVSPFALGGLILNPYSFGGVQALVAFTGGTLFGNASSGGGLATTIDGDTNEALAACALAGANNTAIYVGYDFGVGIAHVFTGFDTWGSNNHGYWENSSASITVSFIAHSAQPSSVAQATPGTGIGTTIAQATGTDANSLQLTNLSGTNTTAFRYAWIYVPPTTDQSVLCEMKFYATA